MTVTSVVPIVINGQSHFANKTFDIRSPSSGEVLHKCSAASATDAARAVDAAHAALKSWRRSTLQERRDVLLRAADIMQNRRDELMMFHREETGASQGWPEFNIETTVDMLKDVAGRVPTLVGMFPSTSNPGRNAIIMREPFGVVLSIAPWNAPYILGTRAVVFPIAAGNTVVLKGSELSPKCMWAIVDVFHQAGLPRGVLNFIVHDSTDAAVITSGLISNPLVKKINFTGSTNVGRIIARQAGEHVKPVVLELGGKAPAIIWEDADLSLAAQQCALGSFLHGGQTCMSTEIIIVHKAVKNAFVEKFVTEVEKLFPSGGDGPILINNASIDKNKRLIANALECGASIIYGDANAGDASRTMMQPIIVDNVTKDMDIYSTESFGPIVSIIGVETEGEATHIANDTEYGLTSAIFTADLRRGLRLAKEIESGAVHINNMTLHDESALPHGGAKSSGHGRFNGSFGLDEWTRTQNVTFDL